MPGERDFTDEDVLNAAALALLTSARSTAEGRRALASLSGHDREVLEAAASDCRRRVARLNGDDCG